MPNVKIVKIVNKKRCERCIAPDRAERARRLGAQKVIIGAAAGYDGCSGEEDGRQHQQRHFSGPHGEAPPAGRQAEDAQRDGGRGRGRGGQAAVEEDANAAPLHAHFCAVFGRRRSCEIQQTLGVKTHKLVSQAAGRRSTRPSPLNFSRRSETRSSRVFMSNWPTNTPAEPDGQHAWATIAKITSTRMLRVHVNMCVPRS